jgi:hemin uptake protein HemP
MGLGDREKPTAEPRADAPVPAVLRSEKLLGAAREIVIDHRGTLYRLRLTNAGKLILTK